MPKHKPVSVVDVSSLPVAAAALAQGFKLVRARREGMRFIFEFADPEVRDLVAAFVLGELHVNLPTYLKHFDHLRDIIRGRVALGDAGEVQQ